MSIEKGTACQVFWNLFFSYLKKEMQKISRNCLGKGNEDRILPKEVLFAVAQHYSVTSRVLHCCVRKE